MKNCSMEEPLKKLMIFPYSFARKNFLGISALRDWENVFPDFRLLIIWKAIRRGACVKIILILYRKNSEHFDGLIIFELSAWTTSRMKMISECCCCCLGVESDPDFHFILRVGKVIKTFIVYKVFSGLLVVKSRFCEWSPRAQTTIM